MLCPSIGPKMFCASPIILDQAKKLFAFSAAPKKCCARTRIKFTKCKSIFGVVQNI